MNGQFLSKVTFIVLLFAGHYTAQAQRGSVYKKALTYLSKEYSGHQLVISDTLNDHELVDFYEDVSLYWKKPSSQTMKILDSLDQAQINKEKHIETLNLATIAGNRPGKIIYFSAITKGMFTAEVFENKGTYNYNFYTSLNKSDIFLFITDNKNTIVKIFKSGFQYE